MIGNLTVQDDATVVGSGDARDIFDRLLRSNEQVFGPLRNPDFPDEGWATVEATGWTKEERAEAWRTMTLKMNVHRKRELAVIALALAEHLAHEVYPSIGL